MSRWPQTPRTRSRREQQIDRILAQVKQQLLRELPAGEDVILSLDKIEQMALDVRERVGQAVAQELTQEQAQAAEVQEETHGKETQGEEAQGEEAHGKEAAAENRHACQACGRAVPYRGRKDRGIQTLAGVVRVQRKVYYCKRCDRCTMPVDERLGLPAHGYTALVERWVAELCSEHAYQRGVSVLARLARVVVSAKEAQRITLAVGDWVRACMQEQVGRVFHRHPQVSHIHYCEPERLAPQRVEAGMTLCVLMDGVMTPMQDGSYREAKVGCLVLLDRHQEVKEIYYTHSMDDAETFGRELFTLTARVGLTQVPHMVAVGDGAHWIWKVVRQHYPQAKEVLDWYHATEYLYEVARASLGDAACPEAVRAWVKPVETQMWNGNVDAVIAAVDALPAREREAQECRRVTREYFRTNQDRMHYADYREQGLPIGSGVVESANKQIVSTRMKGAGMRWSERGARGMGCLRALLLSTQGIARHLDQWRGRPLLPVPSC